MAHPFITSPSATPPSVLTCLPIPHPSPSPQKPNPHTAGLSHPPGGLFSPHPAGPFPHKHPTTSSPPGSSPSRRWRAWPTVLPWGSRAQGCQTSAPRCSSTSSSWVRAAGQGSAVQPAPGDSGGFTGGVWWIFRLACFCPMELFWSQKPPKISQPHFGELLGFFFCFWVFFRQGLII